MRTLRNAQLTTAAAVLLAISGASAQITGNGQTNYDPYNPQMRGQPPATNAAGNPANITPSLIDMGFGTDQGNTGPFVTLSDKQFARMTALRALMELQLAQAALTRTKNPDVKNVATRLTDDYTRWQAGIQRAAAYLKISLPTELDTKSKADLDRILDLNGPEFDQAYLREVAHLQHKALTITQHEVEAAGVTGFRHWAGVMVPELQDEVRMARRGLDGNAIVSRK